MKIIKAQVYDPFMDGVDDMPLRLELLVTGIDIDTPTFEEYSVGWEIKHYKRFLEFSSCLNEDDSNEIVFNDEHILNEPVFPVTVSADAGMWRQMYMRVSEVRRILRKQGRQHECVPDPTYAREFHNVWHIVDTDYLCVECVRDVQYRAKGGQIRKGRQVQVDSHMMRTLCKDHEETFNEAAAASRQR